MAPGDAGGAGDGGDGDGGVGEAKRRKRKRVGPASKGGGKKLTPDQRKAARRANGGGE